MSVKAVRNGLIKKEKTISVCGVKSPDINQPSGIESQEVLAKILKESGELEIKIKQFVNKDRFGKERDTLAGEVYLIKENGDKVSLARELLKSGKVNARSGRAIKSSSGLAMHNTCFVNRDEFEFIDRQANLQKKAREQELIEETKETEEEKTIEISEARYRQMVETIEDLTIQRDRYAREDHYRDDCSNIFCLFSNYK